MSQASGVASSWNGGFAGFAGCVLATGLPVKLVPEVGFSDDRLTPARVADGGVLSLSDTGDARPGVIAQVVSVRLQVRW